MNRLVNFIQSISFLLVSVASYKTNEWDFVNDKLVRPSAHQTFPAGSFIVPTPTEKHFFSQWH